MVDLSRYDRYDPRSSRRLRWQLHAYERSVLSRVLEQRLSFWTAVYSNTPPESAESIWTTCHQVLQNLEKLYQPWLSEDSQAAANRAMSQAWAAAYGDPNDPDVQARIEATAAFLRATNESAK